MNAASHRAQVSAMISPDLHKKLEEISLQTGLSRSRLIDMALAKFAAWADLVDPLMLRLTSAEMGPSLGYQRKESGYRRAMTVAPVIPLLRAGDKTDPYHVVVPPSQPGLRKAVAGGKK